MDKIQPTIGILTFHTPINYGAILQTYALQTYLRQNFSSYKVVTIDFRTQQHIDKYAIKVAFRKNIFLYAWQKLIVAIRYKLLKKKENRFREFIKEEVQLTSRYKSEEDFLKDPPQMDIFIVGSDQVFHPSSAYYKVYFLGFEKRNSIKISYAPSFGMSTFSADTKTKLFSYLNDFDALSCREKDGAEFISSVIGKPVPVVLDPVFLLSTSEWDKMLIKPTYAFKYIFIYELNGGKNLIKLANKVKEKTGFKTICITQKAEATFNVDEFVFDAGPREFIGLLKNAEFVVTDSFHGTAFSLLFQKEFLSYIASPKASTRVRSLLSAVKLENTMVENQAIDGFIFKNDSKSFAIENLDNLISSSKNYLNTAVNIKRIDK